MVKHRGELKYGKMLRKFMKEVLKFSTSYLKIIDLFGEHNIKMGGVVQTKFNGAPLKTDYFKGGYTGGSILDQFYQKIRSVQN